MDPAQRDAQLLSVFDPDDRQALEETVDEILAQELRVFSVVHVLALSDQFERAAGRRGADDQKLVALALAALLRERARQALASQLSAPAKDGRKLN